jgi:hypothetical protein
VALETPADSTNRPRGRRLAAPLLIAAAVWLISLAALLRGTRGEAEARRNLSLRAVELVSWLEEDVASACERDPARDPVARASSSTGPSAPSIDAAPAWRDVLAACDEAAAISLTGAPRLPSLAADSSLAQSLRAAVGAGRFAPFLHVEEIVDDPWPRRARVFARMLADGCAELADRVEWLAGAIALAADLRAVGTIEHGAAAAEIDAAMALRLDDGLLAPGDAARLADQLGAARRRLPLANCVAERETRLLQATVCALAEIAPLRGGRLRADDEPPLSLMQADEAVGRLDRLPALLQVMLSGGPDGPTRRAFAEWRDSFGRALPRIALLLPPADAIAATAGAPDRIDRLLERLHRQANGRG